jgi:hypothetical protein
MTQAKNARQQVAKEGEVKAGDRRSTQQRKDGIICHMGGPPFSRLLSPFRIGGSSLSFTSATDSE